MSALARLKVWAATTGLTLALGAAGGAALTLAWEHQTPFGLAAKLDRAEAKRDDNARALAQCAADRKATVAETWRWSAAYDRIKAARDAEAKQGARTVEARAEATAVRCRAAFDSGYAAGRALNPGDPTDDPLPNPDPRDRGVPDPGGVRDDFSAAWRSGAVRPSARD